MNNSGASDGAAQRTKHDRDFDHLEIADSSGAAFITQLSAARVLDPYGRFGKAGTSASQMFEVTPSNPRAHRMSSLEQANQQARVRDAQTSGQTQNSTGDSGHQTAQQPTSKAAAISAGAGEEPRANGSPGEGGGKSLRPMNVRSPSASAKSATADVEVNAPPNRSTQQAVASRDHAATPIRSVPGAAPVTPLQAVSHVGSRGNDSPAVRVAQALGKPMGIQSAGVRGALGQGNAANAEQAAARNLGPQDTSRGSERAAHGSRQSSKGGETQASRPEFDRLIRQVRMHAGHLRSSSARLHLDPPELGRMLVNVRVDRDSLQLDIRTETDEARSTLYGRIQQLRSALEQAGLNLEQVQIAKDIGAVLGVAPVDRNSVPLDIRRTQEPQHRSRRADTTARMAGARARGAKESVEGFAVVGERRLDVRV